MSRDGGVVATWVAILRRRAVWAGGVFLAVASGATAVVFLSHPVYRAEARLHLGEPPPMSGVTPNSGILSFLRLGGDPFSNDLEILASRSLAEAVVREHGLHATLDAPIGVHRDSVFSALAVQDSTVRARFEIEWTADQRVQVRRLSPEDSLIGTYAVGDPASFGGVVASFRPRRAEGPGVVHVRTVPFGEAVRRTSSGLKVTRPRREANVLEVAYDGTDPDLTRAVVETAVNAFVGLRSDLLRRESEQTVDSLRVVAEGTQNELREAEEALERLQRTTGIVAPDAQSEALIERYEAALVALEAAESERAALTGQSRRVDNAADRVEAWTALVANPRFLENETVGSLLTRLTELEAERTELLARRSPDSREVRTIDAQIGGLDAALRNVASEYAASLDALVPELRQRVERLDELLAGVPARVLELARLQRQARVLGELVVITEQRLRQEELRRAIAVSNVQVIDPPALRYRPVWPRKKLGTAVGLVLAAGAAMLAAVVVERADRSVRGARDVTDATGAPLVAVGVGPRAPRFSPDDASAVGHAAALASRNGRISVASVAGDTDAEAVTEALAGQGLEHARPVRLSSYGGASAATGGGAPVVLVARVGSTRREDLARAARWVREAGGCVAGTIVLCDNERDAATVWR